MPIVGLWGKPVDEIAAEQSAIPPSNPRLFRVLKALRLVPRYELSSECFLGEGMLGSLLPRGAEIEYLGVPNDQMVPKNVAARIRSQAWRISVSLRTRCQQRWPSLFKRDWGETETWTVPNYIPPPREWREVTSVGRGWYDHKSNVVPLRPDAASTEQKD